MTGLDPNFGLSLERPRNWFEFSLGLMSVPGDLGRLQPAIEATDLRLPVLSTDTMNSGMAVRALSEQARN